MLKFKKGEAKQQFNDTPAPRITKNDTYVAEVVKIEPFQSETHPDWAPSIKFIFRVIEEPFFGGFASGLTAAEWNKGNKLDHWLIALGVETANIGDELSSEQLRGQIAKVKVELSKEGFANVKGLEKMHPVDFQRISPNYKKRTPKSAAQAPVQQAPAAPAPAPQSPVITTGSPLQPGGHVSNTLIQPQVPVQPQQSAQPQAPQTPPQITGDDVPF